MYPLLPAKTLRILQWPSSSLQGGGEVCVHTGDDILPDRKTKASIMWPPKKRQHTIFLLKMPQKFSLSLLIFINLELNWYQGKDLVVFYYCSVLHVWVCSVVVCLLVAIREMSRTTELLVAGHGGEVVWIFLYFLLGLTVSAIPAWQAGCMTSKSVTGDVVYENPYLGGGCWR